MALRFPLSSDIWNNDDKIRIANQIFPEKISLEEAISLSIQGDVYGKASLTCLQKALAELNPTEPEWISIYHTFQTKYVQNLYSVKDTTTSLILTESQKN